jgi:hypothetical protein
MTIERGFFRNHWQIAAALTGVASLALGAMTAWDGFGAIQANDGIPDVTGKYHFLSADDTLAILEEEGKLKGYIDVYQSEEESDAVLSYSIIAGTRRNDRIEFRTAKIHQKYYRFDGTVERGGGHQESDPDYLRLTGDLEIVTAKGDAGDERVERRRVVFKSLGKNEDNEDR